MDIQDQQNSNRRDSWSENDSKSSKGVGHSRPLSSKLNAGFSDDKEKYVEITLDVCDGTVSVQNIRGGDPETSLSVSQVEKSPTTSHGTPLRQEPKRLTSVIEGFERIGRTRSGTARASRALKGFKFVTKYAERGGWSGVEERFDELAMNGSLPKSLFGQCIGMDESKEFASELLDALARRRGMKSTSINKTELREFWEQISDPSFDGRLQTFFDMIDKNLDGRITYEEMKKIIEISASANKLRIIRERAEEYATLFMEELDPVDFGYIELPNLETAFLQAHRQSTNLATDSSRKETKNLNPIKRSSHGHFNKHDKTNSGVDRFLKEFKFMTEIVGSTCWSEVEARFDEFAMNGALPKSLFGQCIGMNESKEIASKLFDALARRRNIKSPSINKAELREFWKQLSDQTFDARLQTFFDMVDNHYYVGGRLTQEEVEEIIAITASASKLSKMPELVEEYAAIIMEELDPDNSGYVELWSLELLLQALYQSTHLEKCQSNYRILIRKLVQPKHLNPIKSCSRGLAYFVQDNWKRIWVMALWLGICAGLFTWKFVQYKRRAIFEVMGYCVTAAKGAAETTKFNMALILLPVCRNTITWLSSNTKLGLLVPFDDNINFHKVVAFGIAIGVGIHAISHLTCDFPRLLHATDNEYEPMKPFFGEDRPDNYWWFVKGTEGWTGVVMVVLMAIAYILAQPWFRRNRINLPKNLARLTGFEAFWYSHHLFVIVYVLFIIHGCFLYLSKKWYQKTAWMYLAVPMVLYACERLIRLFRSGYGKFKILQVAVYPGNVLELLLSKPRGFKYTSGQYIFLNCSAVSPFQWHPFSITSAPGDDYLRIHIQSLGEWTSQLKAVFSKAALSDQSGNQPRFPKLLVDGPYGAPTQDYKNYEVLLLVGFGIYAAPLISIIKDVLNNIKRQEESEDGMVESGVQGNKKKPFAIKRAYFYWVTREQGSFEWFKGVMNEVAEYDENRVIELHNYCTSVYEEGDARSALITMLQSIQYAKNGVDVVSGTRVKTHFGWPNWSEVLMHVAINHPHQRVGVFGCGAPAFTAKLKRLALHFSRKTDTKFEFHKGSF